MAVSKSAEVPSPDVHCLVDVDIVRDQELYRLPVCVDGRDYVSSCPAPDQLGSVLDSLLVFRFDGLLCGSYRSVRVSLVVGLLNPGRAAPSVGDSRGRVYEIVACLFGEP